MMDISEYQKLAMRTLNRDIPDRDILINAVMGLCSESGEAIDIVKKQLFQGHDLDVSHLKEELGDIAWYLAEAAEALGVDLDEIFSDNIRKLKKRFPDGFESERSINRSDEQIKEYRFYGWKDADVKAVSDEYPGIRDPHDLYDGLSHIWCADTCAPRMRKDWSENNRTLGQCSITAFLVQDIFGGEVHGIRLEDGNYHCFNAVGQHVFDLTSEQFEDEPDYSVWEQQKREDHFSRKEKYERYLMLKDGLKKYCMQKDTD